MKLLQTLKSLTYLFLVFGFFFSATLVSCGNKKTDEDTTEQTDEHPSNGDEHPANEDEHPTEGEHPE